MFFVTLVSVLLFGCRDKVKKSTDIQMFNSIGMKGQPEYMCFLNPNEGYSFNYITESEEQTEEQLNDPNFLPKKNTVSTIYRTLDGGINWVKVYSINDYAFYRTAYLNESAVYIKIINYNETLKNKLLKFDLKSLKGSVLDFNFERMGEIWSVNQKVFVNSKNNNINKIYSTDQNFKKIDSLQIDKVFKDKITLLNNKPYVLTWNNEIYNIESNGTFKISNTYDLESMASKEIGCLLVADKVDSFITLHSYDIISQQVKKLEEFRGYNIVQGLRSNHRVIYGFIGNVSGSFTKYDLFYSLDRGKTWQVQELMEKNYIHPSYLVDNVLYIYSGKHRFQKIVF
jgi:hypothetical protein